MRALIRADEQRQMAEDVRQSQLEKEGREVLARVLAEEGRSSDLQFGKWGGGKVLTTDHCLYFEPLHLCRWIVLTCATGNLIPKLR